MKPIICQTKHCGNHLPKGRFKIRKKELTCSYSLWLQVCFLVWRSHGNPSAKPDTKAVRIPELLWQHNPFSPHAFIKNCHQKRALLEKNTELTASLTSSCDFNLTLSQIKKNPLDFSRDQIKPIHESSVWVLNICLSQVSLIKYQRAYGPFIQECFFGYRCCSCLETT